MEDNKLPIVEFLNEKGNVKPLVRANLKTQAMTFIRQLIQEHSEVTVEETARGTLSLEVATDKNNEGVVYIEVNFGANQKSPNEGKKGAKPKKESTEKPVTFFPAQR